MECVFAKLFVHCFSRKEVGMSIKHPPVKIVLTGYILFFIASSTFAHTERYLLKAQFYWDGQSERLKTPALVLIEDGRITSVRKLPSESTGYKFIDLGDVTLLPGLIDAHTHLFLQGDPTRESYDEQILKESIPYRTLRALASAQRALRYGFTTLRDLGTEGALYADTDLKKTIEKGIFDGPRLFVATRALSTTGTYPLLGYAWELHLPHGVEIVDGIDEIRHAVRDEVAHGADWIKLYADRSYFIDTDGKIHSYRNFSQEELNVLVEEAHMRGKPVSAHAVGWEGIDMALQAGVDSIEHGYGLTPDLLERMKKQGVYWCPTIHVSLFVAEPRAREGRPIYKQMLPLEKKAFQMALKTGVKIAMGSDAGGYPWTENPVQEFEHMVNWGMKPVEALRTSTRTAAELLGIDTEVGLIKEGYIADIIAVSGNPLRSIRALRHVIFVMKEGKVVFRK